ncbi:MAG: 2,3-bisphosphoglycerate-independent phosphoglycerate mutase [Ruminococcaceae bacterium]|nr:2,3-bisphosphoglycerate-independent phosphoglycerate mutase [Oscillospiraceae bacterium]
MKPIVLIIMDGYGASSESYGNAILKAEKPNIDKFYKDWSHTVIGSSGMDVGLPDGQMGNSEVGHTNIGAGRIVYQDLTRITKSINDGDFFKNPALTGAAKNAADNNTALHLMGLLSDGGVHSHNEHLYSLVRLAKAAGVKKLYVHCILDGRDVPPRSGKEYVEQLEEELKKIRLGSVATVMGRYYAMDRDNRWERVEKAYAAYVYGEGIKNKDAASAVQDSYDNDITDEFVLPIVCLDDATVKKNDSIIFFNFRPDRAREITRTFVDEDFMGFERRNGYFPVRYVCMTEYDASMPNVEIAYPPQILTNTFGEYISKLGKKQLRIAETEKYAHVTFFFNGGAESPYSGEDRVLVDSPKVETYDLMPEMSAYKVADEMVKCVEKNIYDAIILNFANGDMVGHTGDFEAAVKAIEAVDECVGKVVDSVLNMGGVCLLTSDHGNAEKMYEPDGSPFTAHTTNPVPLVLIGSDFKLKSGGILSDLTPTMLDLMEIEIPKEMTGRSLIERNT